MQGTREECQQMWSSKTVKNKQTWQLTWLPHHLFGSYYCFIFCLLRNCLKTLWRGQRPSAKAQRQHGKSVTSRKSNLASFDQDEMVFKKKHSWGQQNFKLLNWVSETCIQSQGKVTFSGYTVWALHSKENSFPISMPFSQERVFLLLFSGQCLLQLNH